MLSFLSTCLLLMVVRWLASFSNARAALLHPPPTLCLACVYLWTFLPTASCSVPLELIFSKLNTLDNQVHDLQVATLFPKSLPSEIKGTSKCHSAKVQCHHMSPLQPPLHPPPTASPYTSWEQHWLRFLCLFSSEVEAFSHPASPPSKWV